MNIGYCEKLCAIVLCAAALPLAAHADTDACTVLTPAQVGTAAGVPVSAGKHVTPSFVKTCTWNPSGSSPVAAITLYLQSAAAYDSGKRMAAEMAAGGASIAPVAVGDGGYYFGAGDQVGLLVKKGAVSFKVTVYARLPVEKKKAMELALARDAVAKLG